MFKKAFGVVIAGLFSASASAASYLDGYFVPSAKIEVDIPGFGSGEADGDGFGVKGAFGFSDQLSFTAEYQGVEFDDGAGDLDQIRLGLGFGAGIHGTGLYGVGEFVQFDDGSDDENGFGIHGGYGGTLAEGVRLHGQVGYLDVGDVDGVEFLVGGAFNLNPSLGLFADYRASTLEGDGGAEVDFKDFRVGARFNF
ncbi:MAG TPA: hypothetical protein VFV27_02475 [Nevskiaceae bacterium]|nr:hypothetical protein [Nevskiaceae bacterium]